MGWTKDYLLCKAKEKKMKRESNQKLTIQMNKDLTKLHIKVQESLPIDTQIRNCIGNHKDYTYQNLLQLHVKMFLDYSNYLLERTKAFLTALKWVKTKEYWLDYNTYKQAFDQLNSNVKVQIAQVKDAENLFNGLASLKDDLVASQQDFSLIKREKFMRYFGGFTVAFTTAYFSIYVLATHTIDANGIFVYVFIMMFAFIFMYLYFYPDNRRK